MTPILYGPLTRVYTVSTGPGVPIVDETYLLGLSYYRSLSIHVLLVEERSDARLRFLSLATPS